MCQEHRHLWTTQKTNLLPSSYTQKNFTKELQEVNWEEKTKILENISQEIITLMVANSNFRKELVKPDQEILDITNKSEEDLLTILHTLRQENNELLHEYNGKTIQ